MKVLIPSSIIHLDLGRHITGRPQRKKSILDALYYVVSCLTPPVYDFKDYQHLRGFKPLSSEQMNRMTRNRFNEVKNVLIDPKVTINGPIILKDDLFIPGIKNIGYKLSSWILEESKYTVMEIDKKYEERKDQLKGEWESEKVVFESGYKHIENAMTQSNISIDGDAARCYLKSLEEILISKVLQKDKFQVRSYMQKLERMVQDVENREFNYSVSRSNHRVNSVFTSMKRELRYFLKSNGKSMVEVDIKTSHPYTMATILTEEFFTQTSEGYNLYSMYPQVHRYFKHSCESMEYQDYVEKFVRYMVIESNVINDNYIEYYTYKREVLTNIKNPLLDTFVSYMCGRFWRKKGIQDYRNLNFNRDIYQLIGNEIGMSREGVKDQFKLYINYSDKHKRINVELIKLLEKRYKEVSQLIQFLSNLNYFKSPLSYLIQRCESYLFLLHGCESLSRNNIPYITIHDSVLCPEEKKFEVQFLLINTICNLTGLRPGIKFKELDNPFLILEETSNEIAKKISKEPKPSKN